MHPLQAYINEAKDGHMTDEAARADITGLVNDPDTIKDVCALFREQKNADATCFAIGKVYDVQGESYGCVSLLSEDVAGIIGEKLQEIHEGINYALISSYLEFRRLCGGNADAIGVWDRYLDLILARNFLPLYENGLRRLPAIRRPLRLIIYASSGFTTMDVMDVMALLR